MGHLCSCHRHVKFDNGAGDGFGRWKADASLIHKLRLRCSYLAVAGCGGTTTQPACSLPSPPGDDLSPSSQEHPAVDRTRSASLPSSPSTTRATSGPPKPPRMRSAIAADRRLATWASELELCRTSVRALVVKEAGGQEMASKRRCSTGSAIDSLIRHASDLLTSSTVRLELLVDLLCRRHAVSSETAATVRRCVSRRAACELISEVVVSRAEISALCDALTTTNCAEVADCLAAVDSLLQLTNCLQPHRSHSIVSPSTNRLQEGNSGDCDYTSADENQTGNSRLQSAIDVDVIHIDPLTGSKFDDVTEQDATSATVAKYLRHRSLFIDPDMTSFPVRASVPGFDRLPVVSAAFNRTCLSDRLADQLAEILLRCRSFRVLTFVKCHRVDECLFRIRRRLIERKDNARSTLSSLNVRLSRVDDVGVISELAQILSSSLHVLSLTGCSIMSTVLLRDLVSGSRCLSELDLGFNDVSEVGPLSDALVGNCSLCHLRLRGNAIRAAAASALFDSLRRNYRLETLDVSGNPIGEVQDGRTEDLWRVLAEALLSNRTLRELKLERCSLGVDACSALGRAVAASTTLRVLDVSMNQSIGDLGVTLLADGLRRNRRCGLRTLSLNMCAVGDVGFRALLVAVKDGGVAGLRHIKLCYNRIGSGDHQRRVRSHREREESDRRRPVSAHYDLRSSEISRLLPSSDITRARGWMTEGDRKGTEPIPSSTPIRRRGIPPIVCRPLSGIVTSRNLLVEITNRNSRSKPCQNSLASHRGDNGTESNTTTLGAAFDQVDCLTVSESTSTKNVCARTVTDNIYDQTKVKELPTVSETTDFGGGDSEMGSSAGSESSDAGGTIASSPATDEDREVEGTSYVLLCQVLRSNPQLKVLLWGNQQCRRAGAAGSRNTELHDDDVTGSVTNSSTVSCSTGETTTNELNFQRTACVTLPRDYDFSPHFI